MKHFLVLSFCTWMLTSIAGAAPRADEDWVSTRDETTGQTTLSMTLTLHGAAAPIPALKYRFIPDEFEQREGNAAIYYLRAMGFLEQNAARDQLSQVWDRAREEAASKGVGFSDLPPYTWLETPPDKLPIDEVKKYLQLTSFQPRDLAVARQLTDFDLDRNIRDVDSPIMVLLPEIQTMRELARNQSLRCRVAIAENRFEDAFEIIGQQFALAHHLSEEPFLVSNLVGAAVASMAYTDGLYLAQMPGAENLYWAYAALPNPIIDIKKSLGFERQLLFLEVKPLAEVDEKPRPTGYWSDFVDRVIPRYAPIMDGLRIDTEIPSEMDRMAVVSAIGASYPGAKRYLLDEIGMDAELVESYPTAQVVFLAQKRFYERFRDEHFKWFFVDENLRSGVDEYQTLDQRMEQQAAKVGWAAFPATQLLPAIRAMNSAVQRIQLSVAMLQTIEAIRMYAAGHDGELPKSLSELPYPAPANPFTGKPIQYERSSDAAALTADAANLTYKLTIRIAE